MTIKQQGGIFGRNPTFNDVEVEGTLTASGSISIPNDSISGNAIDGGTATLDGLTVDTSTLHVDSANNRVGVGTTSPSGTLHAKQNQSATLILENEDALYSGQFRLVTGSDTFYFAVDGTAGGAFGKASSPVIWYSGNQDMIFAVNNGEKLRLTTGGNLKVQSGSGIDFSATSGTGTSELFDDYEEGSWTPAIRYVDATDNGNATETTQTGKYVKIGRMVMAEWRLDFSITGSPAASAVFVTGLPYAGLDNYYNTSGTANSSAGTIQMWSPLAGATETQLSIDGATLGSGSRIVRGTVIYQAQ